MSQQIPNPLETVMPFMLSGPQDPVTIPIDDSVLDSGFGVTQVNPVPEFEHRAYCPSGQTPSDAPWLYADIGSRLPSVIPDLAQDSYWGALPEYVEGAKSEFTCSKAYAPTPGDLDLGDWMEGAWPTGDVINPKSATVSNIEPQGDYTAGMVGQVWGAQERLEDAERIDAELAATLAKANLKL